MTLVGIPIILEIVFELKELITAKTPRMIFKYFIVFIISNKMKVNRENDDNRGRGRFLSSALGRWQRESDAEI